MGLRIQGLSSKWDPPKGLGRPSKRVLHSHDHLHLRLFTKDFGGSGGEGGEGRRKDCLRHGILTFWMVGG